MVLHVLMVDDEEDVLDSLLPGFVTDLTRRLQKSPQVRAASEAAGQPLPAAGRLNVRVSVHGYDSRKLAKHQYQHPVHVHLHLCCEKGGAFRHAMRLLKDHLFAVCVSDLRFSDDLVGSRAGRFFIDDLHRRNPETFGILYSAYQRPEGFPEDRFVRKGSAGNLGGDELLDKIVEGFAAYLSHDSVRRLLREVRRRGLVYDSDEFGTLLKRIADYADLYFGDEAANPHDRRRPRPTLLIDGETGTGKTELAGLLHAVSARRDEPLVAATCSQLTDENLLRSTLFGHVKGAFSGAAGDRQGLVAAAGQGVLLLDDLHRLSDGGSVILHSFLDDGQYSRLGHDEVRRDAHCAVVSTVETPQWEEIKAEGKLADSFVNRVEQLVVRVPPLRQRPSDIACQARVWCDLHAAHVREEMELSPEAVAWLQEFGFPGGNSRKLRDFVKGLVTANARVTDWLDVPEMEEHAADVGLVPGGRRAAAVAAAVPVASGAAAWPPAGDDGWQSRIAVLAAKAVADELDVDEAAAQAQCRDLFERDLPALWATFQQVTRRDDAGTVDIRLFDELLRYYAVYSQGTPAAAAKELGMKDNALREFIYSREAKRDVAKK